MATRNTPRNRVRNDPPETMLDPGLEQLTIVNADGSPLVNGKYNNQFEYVWVSQRNNAQWTRYMAKGYQPVRRAAGEVRPKHAFWTELEDTEGSDSETSLGALIQRSDSTLCKRPIAMRHAEQANTRAVDERRRGEMNKVSARDQAMARQGGAVIRDVSDQGDITPG